MKTRKNCFINDSDRCRLGTLLLSREGQAWGDFREVQNLDARLEEARTICSRETPPDLVTMNSTVELQDIHSGAGERVRLVYPADYDLAPNCVSILDPLGTQLLGSRVGDIVRNEDRVTRVSRVVAQPEQMGAWHL